MVVEQVVEQDKAKIFGSRVAKDADKFSLIAGIEMRLSQTWDPKASIYLGPRIARHHNSLSIRQLCDT
jgi:hypothetical protein